MRGDGIRRRKDRGNAWFITWTVTLANGQRVGRCRRASEQSFQGARDELAQERKRVKEARKAGISPVTFEECSTKYLRDQKTVLRSQKEY